MWYENSGSENDVFVSTRIRLARNIKDYPFEPLLCETAANEIIEKVQNALTKNGYVKQNISEADEKSRLALAEKHIISYELARKKTPCELFCNFDNDIYVMACEEDHIRIQAIAPGLDFEKTMNAASAADEILDKAVCIAFDEKLGYLTHCPTNLGTGMRASVMMFLPALTMTGRINGLQNELSKLGLTVRGTDGEGSAARGCLYQISNCVTLGVRENEIISNLTSAASSIAKTERQLRKEMYNADSDALKDRIMRSVGIAKFAHMISTDELFKLYSDIRLGAVLGILDKNPGDIDNMLMQCMPSVISERSGKNLTARERDTLRAGCIAQCI